MPLLFQTDCASASKNIPDCELVCKLILVNGFSRWMVCKDSWKSSLNEYFTPFEHSMKIESFLEYVNGQTAS